MKIAAPKDNSLIRKNFIRDRDAVLNGVKSYLGSTRQDVIAGDDCRNSAKKNIAEGDLIAAMQNLEIARDSKRKIASFIYQNSESDTPIFVRDARGCSKNKKVFEEGIEAAETLVLCAFEAAKDVLQLTKGDEREGEIKEMAIEFFANFEKNNSTKTQKEIIKAVDFELNKLSGFLQNCGVQNSKKQLTQALHFQNFKQKQNCNLVTISEIEDDERKRHLIVDSNVSFREITDEQKALYDKIAQSDFISPLQKKLMNKYRQQFFSGNYAIPTQLIDIVPGIRNGFEEITMFVENGCEMAEIKPNQVEIIDVRKRCGALSSLLQDDKLAHQVSESNIRQVDALIGEKNGKKIHWNSLNTGSPSSMLKVRLDDFRIVSRSKKAVDGDNHKLSVTPFNAFRSIPNVGDFAGIRNYLKDLSDSVNCDSKDNKNLKSHIKPKGFFGNLFSSKSSFKKSLARVEDEDCKKIFSLAKNLQEDLKKLSRSFIFGLDKENIRLQISNRFNALTKAVNSAIENENPSFLKNFNIDKVPYEEVVVFCKSGKDRTGLSMFCQEIHRIQDRVKISFEKAANQLHLSGHIEALPGSIRVGGGTPGCYQLLDSILPAIPQSQKTSLQPLVGPFAAKNKMPKQKKSFFSKLKKLFFSSKKENQFVSQDEEKIGSIVEQTNIKENLVYDEKDNDISEELGYSYPQKVTSNFTSSRLMKANSYERTQ